ncbi:hypothetical protein P4S72_00590 [Vibrio sp. PP-XX7]
MALSQLTGISPESHAIEILASAQRIGATPVRFWGDIDQSQWGIKRLLPPPRPHPQQVGIDIQQIRDFGESALTSVFMPQATPAGNTGRFNAEMEY